MLAPDVAARIRSIFLHPHPYVTKRHAAALLGWQMAELQIAIAKGEVDTEETCRGIRIPLSEVAMLARERWQPCMIEEALGKAAKDILPPALRTQPVSLRVSKYVIAALQFVALKEDVPVDVIAARYLDRLAIEHSDELSSTIADFSHALSWPERRDVQAIA
jgi:hypothetical protein